MRSLIPITLSLCSDFVYPLPGGGYSTGRSFVMPVPGGGFAWPGGYAAPMPGWPGAWSGYGWDALPGFSPTAPWGLEIQPRIDNYNPPIRRLPRKPEHDATDAWPYPWNISKEATNA